MSLCHPVVYHSLYTCMIYWNESWCTRMSVSHVKHMWVIELRRITHIWILGTSHVVSGYNIRLITEIPCRESVCWSQKYMLYVDCRVLSREYMLQLLRSQLPRSAYTLSTGLTKHCDRSDYFWLSTHYLLTKHTKYTLTLPFQILVYLIIQLSRRRMLRFCSASNSCEYYPTSNSCTQEFEYTRIWSVLSNSRTDECCASAELLRSTYTLSTRHTK